MASLTTAKASEHLETAQDSLDLEWPTAAAGNAIHTGISAKDAIVTALTGATSKSKDHAKAAAELRTSLAGRTDAATAEKALRELIAIKGDVEVRNESTDARAGDKTGQARWQTR